MRTRSPMRLFATALATLMATTLFFVPGASADDAEPSENVEASETRTDRPVRSRIRCHGAVDDAGQPVINCAWTASGDPDAAGYKIIRRGAGVRTVVHESRDLEALNLADTDVEFNTRYRYRVVVVDEAGERLQRSRWNRAAVRQPRPQRLHLDCDPVGDGTVLCDWDAAEDEDAIEFRIRRKVRGEKRELLATVGVEQTSYLDETPADAGRVTYTVLALDADNDIVGRGISRVRA